MTDKGLSTTMKQAIEYIKKHDNNITRYAGGYWAAVNWKHPEQSFGTKFTGVTGKYFAERMREKRRDLGDDAAVRASKKVGWEPRGKA